VTATNHALTGAVIGLVIGQPLIAVPAALASHFVCDALPHFKVDLPDKVLLKTRGFRDYLIADASLCVLLVAVLAFFQPQHWLLASVCAFLATSPDLLSINIYLKIRRGQHWKRSAFSKFAYGIQWFQRPIGAVVEVAWFVAAIIILVPFLS
jgi:hypothetical protein